MMKKLIFFLVCFALSFSSCEKNGSSEYTLYHGGDILTMEGDQPSYVEAVVTKKDSILFAGSLEEAKRQFKGAEQFDLKGKTLMPGFIEPHAHPVSIGALLLSNEIVAPHEWKMPDKTWPAVVGHQEYLDALKKAVNESENKDDYVLVWGYHKAWHGPITLQEINEASGDIPTMVYQRSTHEIYINDAAMKKFKVDYSKLSKEALAQIDQKNNHFWELGYQSVRTQFLANVFGDEKRLKAGLKRMSDMMLQNGITAMMEPSFPNTVFETEYNLLKPEVDSVNRYMMYLIPGMPQQYTLKEKNEDFDKYIKTLGKYNTSNIEFLTNQYKTFSDGAIYSMAFQLKEPFVNCLDCEGEWIVPPQYQANLFDYYWGQGYKIHIHVTGDEGLETYLQLLEKALVKNPRTNHQTTFHHLGIVDEDQADRMKKAGAEASVNPYYLYAMGNKYAEIGLGPDRAHAIAPMKYFTSRGIRTSVHSDFAMAPAEPLLLACISTTRFSDSGEQLRPDLGCSPYEALKAITIDAARTFSKENEIGSIKSGKIANFTIVDENPMKVDPLHIKDIHVDGIVYKSEYHKSPN